MSDPEPIQQVIQQVMDLDANDPIGPDSAYAPSALILRYCRKAAPRLARELTTALSERNEAWDNLGACLAANAASVDELTAAVAENERLRRIAICADAQWAAEADADDGDPAIRDDRRADAIWAGAALALALDIAGYRGDTPYRVCAELHTQMMSEYERNRAVLDATGQEASAVRDATPEKGE